MSAEKIPIYTVLSDEEFQEYHRKKKKQKLLDEMIAATKTPFSVKNVSKNKKKTATSSDGDNKGKSESNIVSLDSVGNIKISDDEWDRIMEQASVFRDSRTPIDKVTSSEMLTFNLEDFQPGDDEYQKMFKNEQAMYAEILKDVSNQAKIANDMVKMMTKKSPGFGSTSKVFPDLLSAANSLNTTRASIVDKMAGLKKVTAELSIKKQKELGLGKDGEGASLETTADNFFKRILSNRKGFIDASTASMVPPPPNMSLNDNSQLPEEYSSGEYYDNNQQSGYPTPNRSQMSYNLTAPIHNEYSKYVDDDDYDDVDAYGYIRNESRNVDICVQVFSDGRVEFVAVDENGEGVDGYELPSEELLSTLNIRPTSRYATDDEGRRYRIIQAGENADLSDI